MKASLSPALKSQQLLQRVWAFALLALILMLSASCSLYLLSAVRAFVNGESLWSKAQKDAIYSLSRYADEGNPVDFAHYQRALQVPRGDAEARIALYDKPLRLDLARKGIEQGQNHPDDVSSLIWLLRTFRYFSWVQEPVAYWKMGDEYLNQLDTLAQEIRHGYEVGNISRENIATWKREIDLINQGVTALTKAFSDSLGQSSRNIVWLLLALNGALAIGLVSLWVWNTWRLILLREQVQDGLNSEKERAETTLAALSDAVITTNAKGLINYVNPAAIGLLGLQKQSYLDKPIKQVLQFYTMDASITSEGLLAQLVSETKESTVVRDEQTHWVRRTDHSIVPVKVLGSAMQREGQTSGRLRAARCIARAAVHGPDLLECTPRHADGAGKSRRIRATAAKNADPGSAPGQALCPALHRPGPVQAHQRNQRPCRR
jgi:PAS domain-containing protein